MIYKFLLLTALFLFALPGISSAGNLMSDIPTADPLLDWSLVPDPPASAGTASAAVPEQPGLSGPEYIARGEESYNIGDYENAFEYFKKALPLLHENADKAKAHRQLAFIHAAFGRMGEVYSEFVESLKLDPGQAPDPNMVSPKIYQVYLKARDEVVREGTIVCNSDPPGAEVYLNDMLLGETPARKEHVPEGEYTLTLKKPGYEPSIGNVTIKKDITLTVEDKLVEARGEIYVASRPLGAAVTFDGRDAGVTPVTLKKVSSGDHKITLKRDYFDPYETAVAMEKSGRKDLDIALKRRVLLIGVTEGEEPRATRGLGATLEALTAPFAEVEDLRIMPAGMKPLAAELKERGLDPGSLSFLKEGKPRLELEDSAVLSGIMEKAGAELALVAALRESGGKKTLTLTLYSTASDSGDRTALISDDLEGLKAGVEGFLIKWDEQEKSRRTTIGARMADREGGGVEIISVLTGSPAASAGLMPGDIITSLDGSPVKEKKDLAALLKPGVGQVIGFLERGKPRTGTLTPLEAALEAPVESGDYLYNLALVSGMPEDASASLNLGNVYSHLGNYNKAVKAYMEADTGSSSGVCTGTALYRLGEAYEKLGLWVKAAASYRKAMMLYPDATLGSAEGPYMAPLARERLKNLYVMGLVKERWWL